MTPAAVDAVLVLPGSERRVCKPVPTIYWSLCVDDTPAPGASPALPAASVTEACEAITTDAARLPLAAEPSRQLLSPGRRLRDVGYKPALYSQPAISGCDGERPSSERGAGTSQRFPVPRHSPAGQSHCAGFPATVSGLAGERSHRQPADRDDDAPALHC